MLIFKCKCHTHVLFITVHRYHFTIPVWKGQDRNGSGRGKLSLVPSRRQWQNTFLVGQ